MLHIKILISTSVTSTKTSIFTRRKKEYRITTFRNSRLFTHILHNIRYNTFIARLNKTKTERISHRSTIRKILTCRNTPTLFYKMKNGSNIRKMLTRERPKYSMIMRTTRLMTILTNSEITKIIMFYTTSI